ncbi:MAG: hypothetical protein LAT81_07765 [Oceanicaulis sp.]|nr:hypothetical protein [Oceanicaulis sp.]
MVDANGIERPQDETFLDAQIAESAVELLRGMDTEQPMLLSALGNRLSRQFGSLRKLLGRRTSLLKILQNYAGDSIETFGSEGLLSVSIASQNDARKKPRYNKTLWAAFAKPIADGGKRYLRTEAPISFHDTSDSSAYTNSKWLEVKPEFIPPADVSKHERDDLILSNIERWCEENRVDISAMRFPVSKTARQRDQNTGKPLRDSIPDRTRMLRDLIEAVPEKNRGTLFLPMNVIYEFLK